MSWNYLTLSYIWVLYNCTETSLVYFFKKVD